MEGQSHAYSKASLLLQLSESKCFVIHWRDICYTFSAHSPRRNIQPKPHMSIPNGLPYKAVHRANPKLLCRNSEEKALKVKKITSSFLVFLSFLFHSSNPLKPPLSTPPSPPPRREAFLPSFSWADGICILTYCKSSRPGNRLQLATAQCRSAWFLLKLEVRPIRFLTVQGRMPS